MFGGSDRYFFELNKLHEQAGHEVIPFAMVHPLNEPNPYEEFFVSQVNYWDNPSVGDKIKAVGRMLYSLEARSRISKLLEETKPDIAHIHLIYHQISPAILPVIKAHGLPIVQTLHDYKPICPTYSFVSKGEICERCQGKHFYHAALQRCNHGSFSASVLNSVEMYFHHFLNWYDLPDIFLPSSEFMRQKMIQYGLPAEKLIHIPLFVDTEQYEYSPQADDYFVYIGRLTPIKGVKTLLRAMDKVRDNRYRLLIIGDGPQRTELEALKAKLNLQNVEFCGYQTSSTLASLRANALFNVLPSECYENCPNAVLESMASGKPSVGARIGGIPELIEHDVDGLLFESGNAEDLAEKLNMMLANPLRCMEMGRMARKKAETQYNAEQHDRQILEIYERLL